MHAITRASEDIAAGNLWKARDRLRGAFVNAPARQDLLDLLGQVLHQMGDLPEAAKYWVLTDRDDDAFGEAYAALIQRHGGDLAQVAFAVPVRATLDELPPLARERLSVLRDAAESRYGRGVDLRWERRKGERPPMAAKTLRQKVGDAIGAVVLIAISAAIVIGLVSLAIHGAGVVVSWF